MEVVKDCDGVLWEVVRPTPTFDEVYCVGDVAYQPVLRKLTDDEILVCVEAQEVLR